MSDYTTVDKMFVGLTFFVGAALAYFQWRAFSGDAVSAWSFAIFSPLFFALVIYVATRYSAVEERIEALLKQIAGNRRR